MKLWRAAGGWKCEAGAARSWRGPGACPRLILLARVLWRVGCGSLLRGSSCSGLDPLE